MKKDSEIIGLYNAFKDRILPQLNITYEAEKAELKKINLFNKKKIYKRISVLYNAFYKVVHSSWQTIYSTSEEFNYVFTKKRDEMMYGKRSLENETDVAFVVEQFFMSLDAAVTSIIGYYDGVLRKETSDQIHDVGIQHMNRMMDVMETKYGVKR